MRLTSKTLIVAALSAGTLAATATGASAGWGSYGGSYDRGDNFRAVSYINPDTGAATENKDVDPNSSCFKPDQYDMQQFSDATKNRNVHNDACFLDDRGNKVGKNIGATFELRGVGFISACPDPDGDGPAVAKLTDRNGDGRADTCFQSSYQEKNAAGDFEYHVRINNTGMPGSSDVKWGLDRDGNGIDGTNDDIKVDWSADGKGGGGERSYSW